jgi:hypothetical protein
MSDQQETQQETVPVSESGEGEKMQRRYGVPPTGVSVIKGQIWRDLDPRASGREIRILDIVGSFAICQRSSGVGPKTRVRLDRFWGSHGGKGKRGFVLVQKTS